MADNVPEKKVLHGRPVPVYWKGLLPEPAVRDMDELRKVLARPGCPCRGPAYYMYRNVARSAEDRRWIEEQRIRFDITVIPPGDLCGEYIKTKGHFHPLNSSGTGYPEIYEVLAGEAHYLIQTMDCSDVVLISACAGEMVIVPPGYGHVTINPSHTAILQMANIVSSVFAGEYQGYEERRGAAFFEMRNGEIRKNPAYPDHIAIRMRKAGRIAGESGTITDPLYELIEKRSPILAFLNRPEEFGHLFREP
ncbi:MAG: glucose-6-phosphate isomerase family protein [Methanoregula sp.]|jgi:glucose-6-phosphate isomerase|uniref:glucose-6-phosphate isomerase family protein n=1 Tax=Methanoregula sp. TaxID=2052170 RepID=UPI003D14CE89